VPGHEHHGAAAFGPQARQAASVEEAIGALSVDPAREMLLIAGSLYLAGEVLSANREPPE